MEFKIKITGEGSLSDLANSLFLIADQLENTYLPDVLLLGITESDIYKDGIITVTISKK